MRSACIVVTKDSIQVVMIVFRFDLNCDNFKFRSRFLRFVTISRNVFFDVTVVTFYRELFFIASIVVSLERLFSNRIVDLHRFWFIWIVFDFDFRNLFINYLFASLFHSSLVQSIIDFYCCFYHSSQRYWFFFSSYVILDFFLQFLIELRSLRVIISLYVECDRLKHDDIRECEFDLT